MILYYSMSFGVGRAESHRLLRAAVSEYIGDDERAGMLVGSMKTGELGKPYIPGFSEFSISHSANAWAVLISDKKCGLDIQFAKKCDIIAIAGRIYASADAESVTVLYEADPDRARREFFRVWTRREALAKALGSSAFSAGLPSVSGDTAAVEGIEYSLRDISVPGAEEMFAAVCSEADFEAGGIRFEELSCESSGRSE